MFIKRMILVFLILSIAAPVFAKSLVRMPTMEQVEELCVPVKLTLDNEVHWFYFKHIKQLDDRGFVILYGRNLVMADYYSPDDILNLDEAVKRYKEIKRINEN